MKASVATAPLSPSTRRTVRPHRGRANPTSNPARCRHIRTLTVTYPFATVTYAPREFSRVLATASRDHTPSPGARPVRGRARARDGQSGRVGCGRSSGVLPSPPRGRRIGMCAPPSRCPRGTRLLHDHAASGQPFMVPQHVVPAIHVQYSCSFRARDRSSRSRANTFARWGHLRLSTGRPRRDRPHGQAARPLMSLLPSFVRAASRAATTDLSPET